MLVIKGGSPNLGKQVYLVRFWQARVLQALIAIRAHRAEILERIRATLGFVHDVSHCQADRPTGREWVGIARGYAAHLASETVSLKNPGSGFFRDAALKGWDSLGRLHQVLAGFQVGPVFMRKNLPSFLIT